MDLAERIRKCAEISESGDALSRKTGIPRNTLESYLTGKSEPKASRLVAIADAAGVSLDWLVAERGPMFVSQAEAPNAQAPTAASEIDSKLYGRVIEAVSAAYKDSAITIIPRELGEQAALIYADLINAGGTWDEKMYGLRVSFENLRRQLREARTDPTSEAASKLQA